MTKEPEFAEEMRVFFESARCAKFTKEELEMYRTAQQEEWDNQNVLDFAMEKGKEQGLEEGLKEGKKTMILEMVKLGIDTAVIARCSQLSIEEIAALK